MPILRNSDIIATARDRQCDQSLLTIQRATRKHCTGRGWRRGQGADRGPHGYTAPLLIRLGSIHNIYIQIHIYILSVKRDKPVCKSPIPGFLFGAQTFKGEAGLGREQRRRIRFGNGCRLNAVACASVQWGGYLQRHRNLANSEAHIPNDSVRFLTTFSTRGGSRQRFSSLASSGFGYQQHSLSPLQCRLALGTE